MNLDKDKAAIGYPSFFLLVAALCFLAFDDYLDPPGVRVFDVLGVAIIFFLTVGGSLRVRGIGEKLAAPKAWLLTALVFGAIATGLILRGASAPLAFLVGFALFITLSHSRLFADNVELILRVMLIVATSALFLQLAIYLVTGKMISFLLTGQDLRTLYAGIVSRPTGLYAEAGSHATATAMLIVPYVMLKKKVDYLVIFSTLSILFSQSLLGVLAVAFLLIYFLFILPANAKSVIVVALFTTAIVALAYWGDSNLTILDRIDRISDISRAEGTDSSYRYRIGGVANGSCFNNLARKNGLNSLLLGEGISSTHYQDACGANTLGWLWTSFGLIGSLFIGYMMMSYMKYDIVILIFLGILLLPYPLVSYGFFWIWLSMMGYVARQRAANKKRNIARPTGP